MKYVPAIFLALAAGGMLVLCRAQGRGPDPLSDLPHRPTSAEQDPKKDSVPIQEFDEEPAVLKTSSPIYPKSALKDTVEGTVYLRVVIDERGSVDEVVVEKGVRQDLNDAAATCIKQWKFKPAKAKGKEVRATVVVPFRFKLTAGPSGKKTK